MGEAEAIGRHGPNFEHEEGGASETRGEIVAPESVVGLERKVGLATLCSRGPEIDVAMEPEGRRDAHRDTPIASSARSSTPGVGVGSVPRQSRLRERAKIADVRLTERTKGAQEAQSTAVAAESGRGWAPASKR